MIAPGTLLGSYEVLSLLGAGGMGEVYRARDTKLGRDVAIKVVSQTFTADPERVARFEREAHLLAALNHPRIAAVYGLEQAAGSQCLVMELVEGDTLAARLAAGPLPRADAIAIAAQIADALQAAHEKGIIHRDLKPANIALTANDQVKVLDFGLAKALDPLGDDQATMSPTLSVAATQAGVILGTAAYMAPEQARGRVADKRSDVWAFGCVLFEMLTGQRPFAGEDAAETLAFVMARDPNWDALPEGLPAALTMLLRACLQKDRRRRLADFSAALFVLEHLPQLSTTAPASPASDVDMRRPSKGRILVRTAGISLVAAGLTAGGLWWWMRPAVPAVVRATIAARGETSLEVTPSQPDVAISPDGSRVVYRGDNRLLVRSLDGLEPQILSGFSAAPVGPFFSPDGEWIGFFERTVLKKIASNGGPSLQVASLDGNASRGATWGADGTIIFATNSSATGLQRVAESGGDPVVLTRPDRARGEVDHVWPVFLPGGRAVLYTITAGTPENSQIAVLDLDSGRSRIVLRGGGHAQYVDSGHLVYGIGGTLRAVTFDIESLKVTGGPVPVLEGVMTKATSAANVAVAANGTLVYVRGTAGDSRRELVWVGLDGQQQTIPAGPRPYIIPRISPDGSRIALTIEDSDYDVWLYRIERGTLERLTRDPGPDRDVIWTPDGASIVYHAGGREGGPGIFRRRSDGIGDPERLTTGNHRPASISGDGRYVAFAELAGSGGTQDIFVIDLSGAPNARALLATAANETNPQISPDGRWLAYSTTETGESEVFVRPFPDVNASIARISTDGGGNPLWSRDGSVLYYQRDQVIMAVRVTSGPPSSWSTPEETIRGPYLTATAPRHFDLSRDGRRFLAIREPSEQGATPAELVLIQNWQEELRRLLPVN